MNFVYIFFDCNNICQNFYDFGYSFRDREGFTAEANRTISFSMMQWNVCEFWLSFIKLSIVIIYLSRNYLVSKQFSLLFAKTTVHTHLFVASCITFRLDYADDRSKIYVMIVQGRSQVFGQRGRA